MLKKSVSIITIVVLFNACAIKQEDSTSTKVLKHTANVPVYAIIGVGMATTLALQGTIIGTAMLLGVKPQSEKDLEKKKLEAEEKAKVEIETKTDLLEASTQVTTLEEPIKSNSSLSVINP